jgi:DNA-binding ferritin-like protein (Dps family)
MKKSIFTLLTISFMLSGTVWAANQYTSTYDKEQVKKDYKAFLEQLKVLNAQYKEITGEINQVVKEEGVPKWDMGEGLNLTGAAAKDDLKVQDLGGGAYLKETAKEMLLTIDLPGYRKDSIKLNFKDGKTLLVNAQRQMDTLTKSFERSFDLPVPGDQKSTAASYADGVLTVKIPKVASQEVVIPVK